MYPAPIHHGDPAARVDHVHAAGAPLDAQLPASVVTERHRQLLASIELVDVRRTDEVFGHGDGCVLVERLSGHSLVP
jgi:hypothetical protein